MRDWYDSPQLEDIFSEQEDRLPNGPLGFLEPPVVEIEGGLPKEIVEMLTRYLNNELSSMELVSQVERIRLDRVATNSLRIVT